MNFTAIILSGGKSERFGSPKALFQIGTETFIERIISLYRQAGVNHIRILLNRTIRGAVVALLQQNKAIKDSALNIRIIGLIPPTETPLETLWRGLTELDNPFFVHPVDFPLVKTETVLEMMKAYEKENKPIVKPVFEERGGHPILFSETMIPEILGASPEVGLRQVTGARFEDTYRVTVADKGVIANINSPEDIA